jgi:hypothetical protein
MTTLHDELLVIDGLIVSNWSRTSKIRAAAV